MPETPRQVSQQSAQSLSSKTQPTDRPIEMRTGELILSSLPPEHRSMPSDFSISLASKGAVEAGIISPGRLARQQPMAGFEDTFTDIVDFIVRATHRIWDEKAIGYLYEHYRSNATVVDDEGIVYGRDQVIANTTQMLSAFPDLRIFAEDIIWCGDETTGFWVSHRCTLLGRNTGYSQWGPPTGRKVVVTCIANTHAVRNQIDSEFVVYNTASLMSQLGYDLRAEARRTRSLRDEAVLEAQGSAERLLGQGRPANVLVPPTRDFADGRFLRSTLDAMWNWRLLDRVDTAFVPSFRFHGPSGREMCGLGDYKAYVLALLAMFPDLTYQVEDLTWMGNDSEGYRAAIRWRIVGTHLGHGFYGQPTGRPVAMWGITHMHLRDGQICEEWTVSNEFDVLVQLAADATE